LTIKKAGYALLRLTGMKAPMYLIGWFLLAESDLYYKYPVIIMVFKILK